MYLCEDLRKKNCDETFYCIENGWIIKRHSSHRWNIYPTRDLQRRPKPVEAQSHYLQSSLWTNANDLNAEKIPAQHWLKPQAKCSLGSCHRSHTLARMKFSTYPFYHTLTSVTSYGEGLLYILYFTIPLGTCKDQGLLEQGVTIFNLHCELNDLNVPSGIV